MSGASVAISEAALTFPVIFGVDDKSRMVVIHRIASHLKGLARGRGCVGAVQLDINPEPDWIETIGPGGERWGRA